ncbi:MAG: hypothetical protein ACSLFF_00250 [Solirubrobacterales bacterium]
MICAMTARRIAPGRSETFIETFGRAPEQIPPEIRDKFKGVYACRQVDDPDVILTFGLFDGTIDEFRALQGGSERDEQLDAIDPMIDEVLFDASFDVVHEFVSEMTAH